MDPLINTQHIVPLAIITASLLGSGHCIAMCGGLVMTFAPTRRSAIAYHLGRLTIYLCLGAISGTFGKWILRSSGFNALPWLTTLLIASALLILGVRKLTNKPLHLKLPKFLSKPYSKLMNYCLTRPKTGAFAVGVFSGLLPCGWLYSFVLAAAVTQSAVLGALALFFFWIGTVPALSSASFIILRLIKPLNNFAPKASGILLISAALLAVAARATPLFHTPEGSNTGSNTEPNTCPLHKVSK